MVFTARRSYASAVLGVVILSVRLSHACFVTKPKNLPAIFFIPHERAILLVKCDFSYSCATADKISTDLGRRAVPLRQLSYLSLVDQLAASTAEKPTLASRERELWLKTLTFECDLDSVEVNQHARHLHQASLMERRTPLFRIYSLVDCATFRSAEATFNRWGWNSPRSSRPTTAYFTLSHRWVGEVQDPKIINF